MKYIDEFRNKALSLELLQTIKKEAAGQYTFMEVCGGHTMAIQKFGIPAMLPDNITLISGPGCPVCVTEKSYIDQVVAYARRNQTIIATFGDLMRVPGSSSSPEQEKARGNDVRMVYSALDALQIAAQNPSKDIVFPAIGFETTSPGTAVAVCEAQKRKQKNFYILSAHKIMPPAMAAIADDEVKIDGYLCPGHVSTITGSSIYKPIAEKYALPCVISGFEPLDILQSVLMLIRQVNTNRPQVEIQYKRAVKPEGNTKALQILEDVFTTTDSEWRGLGIIKKSKLTLNKKYQEMDAAQKIPVEAEETATDGACICGAILKGLQKPTDCRLFGRQCTPENPVGACMVSGEGACQAYFKFGNQKTPETNEH